MKCLQSQKHVQATIATGATLQPGNPSGHLWEGQSCGQDVRVIHSQLPAQFKERVLQPVLR